MMYEELKKRINEDIISNYKSLDNCSQRMINIYNNACNIYEKKLDKGDKGLIRCIERDYSYIRGKIMSLKELLTSIKALETTNILDD